MHPEEFQIATRYDGKAMMPEEFDRARLPKRLLVGEDLRWDLH